MTTTLPLFWHLSEASKKERLDASVKLIGALEQFQAQFVPQPAPDTSGSDDEQGDEEGVLKSDGLDILNAQDVSYSIRRLVRGLASPRESSRLGFAVALTELLSRINTVTCVQILNIVMDSSKFQGSMTGQEERDVLFARLFGIMSIVQSGLLVRTGPLSTSASSATLPSTLSSYEEVLSQLLILGEKKSWLRESAWFTIKLAIDAIEESEVPWKNEAIESTLKQLFIDNKIWSPEKVALALKLQDLFSHRNWNDFFSPPFKNSDLFSPANLQALSKILKGSTTDEDGQKDPTKAPSGSWKPELHFVWDIIFDQLLPGPNGEPSRGSFQEFYRVVVDESLFSSTSSPQRKYWGFQVFQKALKRVNEDSMPMLFTKNFMRSWINHLSKQDRYLHKIALQTVKEVQAFVQDKPQLGFALILQLTGVNGNQQFDKFTKTKTVESVLASLDAQGIKNYIDYILTQTDESDGDLNIAATNARRTWIIDQLGALIQNGRLPKEDEWVQSILDWLALHGLFVVKKKSSKSPIQALRSIPKPAFSEEHRQQCRSKLLTSLSNLNAQTIVVKSGKLGEKATKASAVASDGKFWVAKVLETIQRLENDSKHVSSLAEADEDEQQLYVRAREVIETLRMVNDGRQEAAKGAELLLLAIALQHHCLAEQGDLDLESFEKAKKATEDPAELEDAAFEPIDVLVDTIIGYLEKSTAYMRSVSNQVFALISGSVKGTTIDLIVMQLERRDPAMLAKDQDEEMDNEDEDGGASAAVDSDQESSSGESDVDAGTGNDSNYEEVDAQIRANVEEALRINGIEPPTGDTDDDDDDDEELMDDDQMMAIDEKLAEVFRSTAGGRKTKDVDAQREATHFKNRVLDLVDIFIKKQSSNPLILRLISPLMELIAGTGQDERQLSDKAKGILRTRIGKAKETPSQADSEEVRVIAGNLHTRARKTASSDFLGILSQSSLYVSKILINLEDENSVIDMYRESLIDFVTRKNSHLNATYFNEFFQRFPAQGWTLRTDLLDLASKAVNAYRQSQVLQLLQRLVPVMVRSLICSPSICLK
ncbi:hypothetical protein K443DRAFT_89113 [Laccaria amethystina LaAM-08-1]|uniref:DNA polymerase V n=1 Tax=Laccaria amethystina LaAM-08-1 TaxID=1095629 RepID=A0A0C9XN40_9AGAR|nr:hypothetical protein K443DRAFT_89113 [Laccaria amethystina LaAM-08-1]